MSIPNATYPFDPTGVAASNLITGERQIIPAANSKGFVLMVPFAAPYYRASMRVIYVPNGRELVEGVDYYCTHYFYEATTKLGQPVYGSITILDKTLVGSVDLRYQTVGGEWTIDEATIIEILSQTLLDPRTATWEQIVELPHQFPPTEHDHDINDEMGRMQAVVTAVYDISSAIREAASGTTEDHLQDFDNPHETTAAQVGLGAVVNGPMATQQEAVDGLLLNRYINPFTLRYAIQTLAGDSFTGHLSDFNNPHQVTATHIGLGNVDNYFTSTLAEAVAGTATNRFVHPAGMKAHVDARLAATLGVHEGRKDNPHEVTKSQIGLGSVPNYPMATQPQALAGVSADTFMSPFLAKLFVDNYVGDTLYGHIGDHENPHAVTKAQVGLSNVSNLPIASLPDMLAGIADSGYVTPRLAYAAFQDWGGGGGGSTAHLTDYNNPHQVTAEQVGAYSKTATDTFLGDKLGRYETAVNSAKLNGQTVEEIIGGGSARFMWAPVNPIAVDDGFGNTLYSNEDETYQQIGYYMSDGVPDPDNPPADVSFFYTGGEARGSNDAPSFLVRVNLDGVPSMAVEQLSGIGAGIRFGYVVDGGTGAVSIYSYNPPNRNAISVLVLSQPNQVMGGSSSPVDGQPPGLIWAESTTSFLGTAISNAQPGELYYGPNPLFSTPEEPGMPLVEINVVDSDNVDDLAIVQSKTTPKWEKVRDWLRLSASGSVNHNAQTAHAWQWGWNGVDKLVGRDLSPSLLTLRSDETYLNYDFEVDVSIDVSTEAGNGAVGVCVAGTRINGRDYGIYAMRYAQAPTVAGHKLLTIALNPYQADQRILATVELPNLSPISLYNGTANVCRIRVKRLNDVLTITTSQWGSTDMVSGATSTTIDLALDPYLAMFVNRPTGWGVAKFFAPSATFDLRYYPGQYQSYIVKSMGANHADTSRLYYFTGLVWSDQAWDLSNPYVKPGRLIHSPMTCINYFVRRDGSLQMLPTVGFSRDGTTILTP